MNHLLDQRQDVVTTSVKAVKHFFRLLSENSAFVCLKYKRIFQFSLKVYEESLIWLEEKRVLTLALEICRVVGLDRVHTHRYRGRYITRSARLMLVTSWRFANLYFILHSLSYIALRVLNSHCLYHKKERERASERNRGRETDRGDNDTSDQTKGIHAGSYNTPPSQATQTVVKAN